MAATRAGCPLAWLITEAATAFASPDVAVACGAADDNIGARARWLAHHVTRRKTHGTSIEECSDVGVTDYHVEESRGYVEPRPSPHD